MSNLLYIIRKTSSILSHSRCSMWNWIEYFKVSYLYPPKCLKFQKSDNIKYCQKYGATQFIYTVDKSVKWHNHFGNLAEFTKAMHTYMMNQQFYSGIHAIDMCTHMQQRSCTKMLIATLVIITKKMEWPRCLPTVEWTYKLCYVFTS